VHLEELDLFVVQSETRVCGEPCSGWTGKLVVYSVGSCCESYIRPTTGGGSAVAFAARCTNLDHLEVETESINPDQQRRLDLLLERKRLVSEARALAGAEGI
jgi:hypothetical protein